MAYEQPTAPRRDKNQTNTTDGDWKQGRTKKSRQEQFTGDGVRTVKPNTQSVDGKRYTDTTRTLPQYLKVGPNTQGTGTLKNPLNAYQRKVFPAVADPDPIKDRTANNKAPKRDLGKPRL